MHRFNRRDALRLSAATATGLLLPALQPRAAHAGAARAAKKSRRGGKPDFTVAFLTDMHVHADQGAPEGFASALRSALAGPRPPELLVTGGDLVMDILGTGPAEADAQYALFDAQLAAVRIPVHHTMGNHDMLGVYEKSGLDPSHPQYGKTYFHARFKQEHAYKSFDHEGWHFVILDSLGIKDRGYIGWIDEEQRAWLEDDLAAAGKPTVVFTHIPLWSNYIEINRGIEQPIPHGLSIVNAHEVAPILQRNAVKLVLAGHLHVNETFTYKGIEYATVGAVSGNWWDGPRDGFEEGWARLEFRRDEVTWEYVDYGWEAQPSSGAETATSAA